MTKNHNFNSLDFFLNEAYWAHLSISEDVLPLRTQVLNFLVESLKELDISFLYDGKTYHDLYTNDFPKDNIYIDEVIINIKDKQYLLENISTLENKGFDIIKYQENEISLINSKRIINIKFRFLPFFLKVNNHKHFNDKNNIHKKNKFTNLYLLRKMIFNRKFILKKIYSLLKFSKKNKTVSYTTLDLGEFLKLNIEAKNSINWSLRKPHLDIVTKGKTYIKVREVIKYLSNSERLEKLKMEVIEVDTSSIFDEPVHLNKQFWHTGNNFYFYPILFGFKINVVNYTSTNEYILKNLKPNLYSKEYYEKLENMDEKEISNLFKKSPLEVTDGNITSGRHRTFAMIGRILDGKNYIPIYAKIIKS